MAKKKAGKVIQMLSPANYIRTRARNLPVYECVINANWEETKLAYLLINRRHTNGNVTVGIYLVDLLCLGVKDTFYLFNVSESEYSNFVEKEMGGADEIKKIDYNLAHNIIFAGCEFAEEFGFKPHKDFTSTTKFILDEDTDDIPLLEIECGIEGLPALLPDMWDDKKALRKVISQLENEVGIGNFLLLREDGSVMTSIDEDPNYEDDFSDFTFEEKVDLFEEFYSRYGSLEDDELDKLLALVDSLSFDFLNEERCDQHYCDLSALALAIEVNADVTPDELLNGATGQFSEETKMEFLELIEAAFDPEEYKAQSKNFTGYEGAEAAVGFLDFLVAVSSRRDEEAIAQIKMLAAKYPDYSLVQLKYAKFNFMGEDDVPSPSSLLNPSHFFGTRTEVHPLEYFYYVDYLTGKIISEADFDKACAWIDLIEELPASLDEILLIKHIVLTFQVYNVAAFINEGKH